ncbi:TetR family transcriptional regulator [Streptomyces sp. NPDC056663]|uniref:TetR family transcriptional regulator n=1 Tax=Streptomyces sp. NPDC056663 TaxID=3345899 RepID=UPI0036934B33
MQTARTRTRDIARGAIRDELAQVARDQFRRHGFDKVTFDDLAAAADVSRSTVLRYFGSKEEVVLSAFDTFGDRMAEAVRARPAGEADWTVLRRALDPVVEHLSRQPSETIDLLRLVHDTPALCTGLREKSVTWHQPLMDALAERPAATPVLAAHVRVAAAMDCLTVALEHWVGDGGRADLATFLDDAFSALGSG